MLTAPIDKLCVIQTEEKLIALNLVDTNRCVYDIELLMRAMKGERHRDELLLWMWQVMHSNSFPVEEKQRMYKGLCCLFAKQVPASIWLLFEDKFNYLHGVYDQIVSHNIEPNQFAFVVANHGLD